jgi:ELWxxDGT repeat protein
MPRAFFGGPPLFVKWEIPAMHRRRHLRTARFAPNVRRPSIEPLEDRRLLDGTVLVKDIRAGSYGSHPLFLANVGGTLYFSAHDGASGEELWRSDGTPAGTALVKDIRIGSSGANPRDLTNVGGTLYFSANDVLGFELWKSDGTAAGTVLVKDISGSVYGGSPNNFANVGGTLYFSANDGASGFELWKSNGTAAGTVLVKNIRAGSAGSEPRSLTNVAGTLYFTANDGVTGHELWKSDGTAAGTVMVKDINAGSSGSIPNYPDARYLANVGGTLYFSANDGASGRELWKSDGTAAGTVLVKDINAGSGSSNPYSFTNFGGMLFFGATDGASGRELWKSDGTMVGTVLVKDINAGSGGADPRYFANVGGTLYFSANDGASGYELWKSDGTAAGTVLAEDLTGDGSSSFPTPFEAGGRLFVVGTTEQYGRELRIADLAAPLAGDYNRDGDVDGADFLLWQRTLGASATPAGSGADGNFSGTVDAADLGIWRDEFGDSEPSPVTVAVDDAWAILSEAEKLTNAESRRYFPQAAIKVRDALFASGDFTALFTPTDEDDLPGRRRRRR